MSAPVLETKAVVPPIAALGLGTLLTSAYKVAAAFGWLSLTADQQTALAGLGGALLVTLSAVLAYLLPHTARPDLEIEGEHPPQ